MDFITDVQDQGLATIERLLDFVTLLQAQGILTSDTATLFMEELNTLGDALDDLEIIVLPYSQEQLERQLQEQKSVIEAQKQEIRFLRAQNGKPSEPLEIYEKEDFWLQVDDPQENIEFEEELDIERPSD